MNTHRVVTRLSIRLWSLLILAGCLGAIWSSSAVAGQTQCVASPASATFNLPDVTVTQSTPNGLLGSPSTVNISFNCLSVINPHRSGRHGQTEVDYGQVTIQLGSLNATEDTSHTSPNGGLMLKTNVPGIDIVLTGSPKNSNNGTGGPAGVPGWELATICYPGFAPIFFNSPPCSVTNTSGTVATTITAQLVKVGPSPPQAPKTITGLNPVLQFANYTFGKTDSSSYYGSVSTPAVTITTPSCSVTTSSVNKTVLLPSIPASQFSGTGSTAGNTAFTLQLTDCPTGLGVSINLDTSDPWHGANGVIESTRGNGYAHGIGVQVLKADGSSPVTFGTPFSTGTTSAGSYTIHLNARYYQIHRNVKPGNVKAVATYTMSYQ